MNDLNASRLRSRSSGGISRGGGLVLAVVFFSLGLAADRFWLARQPTVAMPAPGVSMAEAASAEAGAAPVEEVVDPAVVEAVKQAIPNVTATSVEAGARTLHVAAVTDFKRTLQDLRSRQDAIEQEFAEAQRNQSKEQQEVALQKLRALQAEQTATLQQIAANSKAQVDAFQQLKGAGR